MTSYRDYYTKFTKITEKKRQGERRKNEKRIKMNNNNNSITNEAVKQNTKEKKHTTKLKLKR